MLSSSRWAALCIVPTGNEVDTWKEVPRQFDFVQVIINGSFGTVMVLCEMRGSSSNGGA
jgi:hypothetical protein